MLKSFLEAAIEGELDAPHLARKLLPCQ